MRKINRENYESWYLDFLEGQLSLEDRADFILFLENNPDLVEPEELVEMCLPSDDATFDGKLKLLKEEQAPILVSDDTLIARNEGLLSATENLAIDHLIAENKDLAMRDRQFKATYAVADSSIVFPSPSSLIQKNSKRGIIYFRYAVAAALLLLFLLVAIPRGEELPNQGIANQPKPTPAQIIDTNPDLRDTNPTEKNKNLAGTNTNDSQPVNTKDRKINAPHSPSVDEYNPEGQMADQSGQGNGEGLHKNEPNRAIIKVNLIDSLSTDLAQDYPTPAIPTEIDSLPNEIVWANNSGKTQELDQRISEHKNLNLWQMAGKKYKEEVLQKERVTDYRIRENNVSQTIAGGLDKVTEKKVEFKDKSNKDKIRYRIKIGSFRYSRNKEKK